MQQVRSAGTIAATPGRLRVLLARARAAADSAGRCRFALLAEALYLRYAAGKLGFSEYFDYELYDGHQFSFAQKRAFVGWRMQREFDAMAAREWWAVVEDKVVLTAYLQALGLAVTPLAAVYHGQREFGHVTTLSDRAACRLYLCEQARLPLFGKPVRGGHGIGAMSIVRRLGHDQFVLGNGQVLDFDQLFAIIGRYSDFGYLFQDLLQPAAATRPVCGERLTGLRITTLVDGQAPLVGWAAWKIPIGNSMVDNTSDGNLCAVVDVDTGVVLRAGRPRDGRFVVSTHHPDSGHPFVGFVIPDWHAACELCARACKTLTDIPIQGWDVALTANGPVLLETNVTGDIGPIQLETRSGFLTPRTRAILARCRPRY